jgi:hypothetical protein
VFGLPNPVHAQRCEECRADVEAALGAHFGHPVQVRIVVDDQAEAPPVPGAPAPPPDAHAPDDEAIDLHDLVDATDLADTGVDRVTAVFPGAELVDDGQDRLL